MGFLEIASLMVSRDSGTDMKGKVVRRIFSLGCAAIFVLLLTGCDPTAGATNYEVIYPSGYSRDCYTYDEKSSIEGSSYYLHWEKADDYKKTYNYDMHILDENGSVLYSYPKVGSEVMRGSVQEDSKAWVCAEHWTAPHYNGYVEDWLKESDNPPIYNNYHDELFSGSFEKYLFQMAFRKAKNAQFLYHIDCKVSTEKIRDILAKKSNLFVW